MQPAMMLATPLRPSHQRGPGSPAVALNAAHMAMMPSERAYAPHNQVSVIRVRSGQKSASTPKAMAAMPRRSSSHQLSASDASNPGPEGLKSRPVRDCVAAIAVLHRVQVGSGTVDGGI